MHLNRFTNKVKTRVKDKINRHMSLQEEMDADYIAQGNRYDSFAPIRNNAMVKYYIDGHDYCWAVAEAIESAEDVIFIEDWWLSPELYLKRPPSKYPEFRIDTLLKRKAEEGVKIFIVVYKEVALALTLDSAHTKSVLQEAHENIIVQRHPDHAIRGTFFWSHHEKFVIIDNKIAFLGGIDLCYGRWDTHAHRLADFTCSDPTLEIYPGQDYSDARLRDFQYVKDWDMKLIDKTVVPRMPWHDISLCMMGEGVLDVARHFCDRWNFIKNSKALDKKDIPFLKPPKGGYSGYQNFQISTESKLRRAYRFDYDTDDVHGTCSVQVLRSSAEWSSGIKLEKSIQNAYFEVITNAKYYVYIENQFFITTTEEDKQYVLQNQIGAAIVSRIVRAHEQQEKFKVIVLMPLMPAFPAELSTKEAATARLVMYYQYISICSGERSIYEQLKKRGINPEEYLYFYSLRSFDRINRPFIQELLARDAGYTPHDKHGQPSNVIKSAFTQESNSEVWIDSTLKHQEPDKAIEQQEVNDYVTEELYIHAKLLIADDRIVIMGSANLNDRSQCGDRDSEIALITEDRDMIPSRMNGQPYQAGRFAATLRRQLWKEHIGLIPEQEIDKVHAGMLPLPVPQIDHTNTKEDDYVMDPLDDETLLCLKNTAAINTKAFREVFHCVPDDTITNWDDYHKFYPDPDRVELGHVHDPNMSVHEVRQHLNTIRGHLVEFPTNFLCNEDLQGQSRPLVSSKLQHLYT